MINLQCEINESEWVEARKLYLFRANYIKPGEIAMATLMLVGTLLLIAFKMVDLWAYILVAVVLGYYALIVYRYFIESKQLYAKATKVFDLTFSKEEVSINGKTMSWDKIQSFDITKSYFFVMKSREEYVTIPKRVMNEQQAEELQVLLEDKLVLERKPKDKGVRWY